MMDPRSLAAAVFTRAEASPHFLAYRQGEVETRPAKGYAVFYFGVGSTFGDRHSSGATRLRWGFRAKCVGYTADQCLYVAVKVRGLYLNWSPDTTPAASWLTEVEDDPPLLSDAVEGDVRYSITPAYTLTTSRS